MEGGVGILLTLLLMVTSCRAGSKLAFLTDHCPGVMGPEDGALMQLSRQQRNGNVTASWYMPEEGMDCWATLRGQPKVYSRRSLEIRFRGIFSIKGWNYGSTSKMPGSDGDVVGTACETGYFEIYEASDAGVRFVKPKFGPVCGGSSPSPFHTDSQSLVLHVYMAPIPEYLLATTIGPSMEPVTDAPATTEAPYEDDTTGSLNITTLSTTPTTTTTTTTPRPLTYYEKCLAISKCPYFKFNFDFTSYIPGGCYEDGVENDHEQIYCMTGRCLDTSLICDGTGSNNCGDWTDQLGSACIKPTMPPQPVKPPDWTWLYALLASLGALLVLCYCCWRPGYIPWRLARLRNLQFGKCGKIGRCCRQNRGQGPCSGCGCCGPAAAVLHSCFSCCCTQTESGFPDVSFDPNRKRKAGLGTRILMGSLCMRRNGVDDAELTGMDEMSHSKCRGMDGGPWCDYAYDDGMHVRELR